MSRWIILSVILIGIPLLVSFYFIEWSTIVDLTKIVTNQSMTSNKTIIATGSTGTSTSTATTASKLNAKINVPLSPSSSSSSSLSSYCLWYPYNHSSSISTGSNSTGSTCMETITKHMTLSLTKSRAQFLSQFHQPPQQSDTTTPSSVPLQQPTTLHRRWLFLGDSTVVRTFGPLHSFLLNSSLQEYLYYRSSTTTLTTTPQKCYYTNTTSTTIVDAATTSTHVSSNNTRNYLNCTYILAPGRCDTMEQFQLQRFSTVTTTTTSSSNSSSSSSSSINTGIRNQPQWQKPNHAMGEGPVAFGYNNPYCTDCFGCPTHVVTCTRAFMNDDDANENTSQHESISNNNEPSPNNATRDYNHTDRCDTPSNIVYSDGNSTSNTTTTTSSYIGPSYGGYMSIEFARDVELQTIQYNTTQENLVLQYIGTEWNTPIELLYEFGRPICVVGTGHHDVTIPHLLKDVYIRNVQWYIDVLLQQCDYIIWISNNCPLTNDFAQTKDGTYEWNMAVRDMIVELSRTNQQIRSNVFFLDVYNASITYPHHDNIHMSPLWYDLLSSFLQSIMQQLTL